MSNPNGPYPGRQLFLGRVADGRPAFAYLVTGRSPQSRERRAVKKGAMVVMGPIGGEGYDPLRHYTAVKYDVASTIMVVSNGIQTEAIYETYKLLYNVKTSADAGYLAKVMDGAAAEPDSMHTPRIAGVITPPPGGGETEYYLGLVRHDRPAWAERVRPDKGDFYGISTYLGDLADTPPFDPAKGPAELAFKGGEPREIARQLFDLSAAMHNGGDIRVCALAGVLGADNAWELAVINTHKK